MNEKQLIVNRMPAITWHRFNINEAEVTLPEVGAAPAEAVAFSVPAALQQEDAALQTALAGVPEAQSQWETGMGVAGDEWLDAHATARLSVVVPEGVKCAEPLVVRVTGANGSAAVAAVDVVVQRNAQLTFQLHTDSPEAGSGVVATRIRLFVADNAQLHFSSVQTLDNTWQHLDNMGMYVGEGARVNISQTVLGAAESYTGFACNLAGTEADAVVDTRYLGHGANKIDFNYVIRQRGVQSTCTLSANGVLMDASSKVLRGTIDLVHGAKGAIGQENETVLLVNEDVRNKTIPILLCDEDDVQGAHGATIGHVNPEQLGYMRTRGLTAEQVEDLFAVASFDYAAHNAFDSAVRNSVERLGATVLGSTYEIMQEGE